MNQSWFYLIVEITNIFYIIYIELWNITQLVECSPVARKVTSSNLVVPVEDSLMVERLSPTQIVKVQFLFLPDSYKVI